MIAQPARQFLYLAAFIIASISLGAGTARAQAVLQGTVTDRNTGNPIAGVAVSNGGNPLATTDANGMYSLTAAELNKSASGVIYFQSMGYYVASAQYTITTSP